MKIKQRKGNQFSRRQDPSLAKIIVAIVIIGAVAFGVMQFTDWFKSEYVVGEVAIASPVDSFAEAEKQIAEGDVAAARESLANALEQTDDPAIAPKALLMQARLDRDAGDTESALAHAERGYKEYPNSPDHPATAALYGSLLEAGGRTEESLEVFDRLHKTAPPEWQAAAISSFARQKERDGDDIGARETYREALGLATWGSEPWLEAAEGLGRLNTEFIFSSARTPESKTYNVQRGDSLTSIGIELNTTLGLLMRANGIDDPNKLHLGQSLKYTPKDFRIVIERSTNRLFLFDSDGLFGMYRVGLGKPHHETAIGQYRIGNKEKDPTWFKPGAGPIAPGDPDNELGTRWMPLVPAAEDLPTDLGIHGTIRPDSIGKYESMGCPRMHNADVEELYDLVVRATPVAVVEKYYPEDAATG